MERNSILRTKADAIGGGWLILFLVAAATAAAQPPVWVAPAPGPNTLGQVENIDEGEVVGAINAVAAHPTDPAAPHADSRDMAMAANGVLLEADDGGIYRRTNPRTNAGDWFSMNGNIQATEFHAVAWDAKNLGTGANAPGVAPGPRTEIRP